LTVGAKNGQQGSRSGGNAESNDLGDGLSIEPTRFTSDLIRFHHTFCSKACASASA